MTVANRPGLSALDWRVGTYPDFLATMAARLSSGDLPELAGLRSRDPADFTMALLDGWAAVADVLTFYTERIANEGYLRTATDRGSVVQLARLLGYTPRPGVASSTYLAFTVASGAAVTVPAGSQAQSIPAAGELPATFETGDPLIASSGYNAFTLRRSRLPLITPGSLAKRSQLVLAGVLSSIRAGDAIMLTFPDATRGLFRVTAVQADPTAGQTVLSLTGLGPQKSTVDAAPVRPVAARIPEGRTRLDVLTEALRKPPSVPPASERDLSRDPARLFGEGSALLGQLVSAMVPAVAAVLGDALAGSVQPAPEAPVPVRFQVKAALFGHQAPLYPVVPGRQGRRLRRPDAGGSSDPAAAGDRPRRRGTACGGGPRAWRGGRGRRVSGRPTTTPTGSSTSTACTRPSARAARSCFSTPICRGCRPRSGRSTTSSPPPPSILGLTGRVSRLTLDKNWPNERQDLRTILTGTTVLAADDPLTLAEESIDDQDVGGAELELDGLHTDLQPGRWVVVAGERTDGAIRDAESASPTGRTGVPGAELSMIAAVEHRVARVPDDEGNLEDLPGDRVHTFLRLATPLAFTYLRPTVTVYGNVVAATHGKSTTEILGSGDSAQRNAQYPLKQPPLTYLPAPTAAGAASTLQLFVDGVRWDQADDLVDAGPTDRRYVVRVDDAGTTRVVFGDGVHGAVPPTGVENITAGYRSGIGLTGNLGPGRITLLTSRPLGVTDVTNPIPATGGADPESRDVVRANAPLTVQALDRLVSVADYASFSRAFAGIGSADAREVSDGLRPITHVTVSGIDDAPIDPASELIRNLTAALLDAGDPDIEVRVAVRALRLLVVKAGVGIDADRRWSDVEPALRAALLAVLGPAARQIGQPVTQAAVLALMQRVPGVSSVDLDILDSLGELDVVGTDPAAGLGLRAVVPAATAHRDLAAPPGSDIVPGELVVLDPQIHDTVLLEQR